MSDFTTPAVQAGKLTRLGLRTFGVADQRQQQRITSTLVMKRIVHDRPLPM